METEGGLIDEVPLFETPGEVMAAVEVLHVHRLGLHALGEAQAAAHPYLVPAGCSDRQRWRTHPHTYAVGNREAVLRDQRQSAASLQVQLPSLPVIRGIWEEGMESRFHFSLVLVRGSRLLLELPRQIEGRDRAVQLAFLMIVPVGEGSMAKSLELRLLFCEIAIAELETPALRRRVVIGGQFEKVIDELLVLPEQQGGLAQPVPDGIEAVGAALFRQQLREGLQAVQAAIDAEGVEQVVLQFLAIQPPGEGARITGSPVVDHRVEVGLQRGHRGPALLRGRLPLLRRRHLLLTDHLEGTFISPNHPAARRRTGQHQVEGKAALVLVAGVALGAVLAEEFVHSA